VCLFAENIGNLRFIISTFLFTFQEEMKSAIQKCQSLQGIPDGKCGSPHDKLKEYRDFHKWLY
jgi:hypothetical protein